MEVSSAEVPGTQVPRSDVPRIVLTPGEPAGIGPDITALIAQRDWDAELVAVASPTVLRERAEAMGLELALETVSLADPPRPSPAGTLRVLPVVTATPVVAGRLDAANAPYVLDTLRLAVGACLDGTAAAMVTGPVQKSVINEAGIPFSGHTEFLAAQSGCERVVMMLACETLRVALVTTHLPLASVPAAISTEALTTTLEIIHRDLQHRFGIESPVIAVLGLNPHAGESGHLGREEIDTIIPALETLRQQGMQLLGPLPADTAFNPDTRARCDCYLAMYHDQGLPVLKYAGFGDAINITLGLPLVRTSVDHGTALDLAGSGKADPGSLVRAIETAIELAGKATA